MRKFLDWLHNLFSKRKIQRAPIEEVIHVNPLQHETYQKPETSLIKAPKGENKRVSKYFSSSEFDCKCSYPDCRETLIDKRLIAGLERVRELAKMPIKINSGYRCERHNKDVGGVSKSRHRLGLACDIPTVMSEKRMNEFNDILKKHFPFVLIYKGRNFTHVDMRSYPKGDVQVSSQTKRTV